MDTLAAYYCFVNLGWPPSQYDSLPIREKLLVNRLVLKSIKDNKQAAENVKRG